MKSAKDTKRLRDAPRAAVWLLRAWLGAVPPMRLSPDAMGPAPSRIIVLIDGPNPTFDYYLAPRLALEQSRHVEIIDMRNVHPQMIDPSGAIVILCRYLPRRWESWLKAHWSGLAGAGLFLDDDLVRLVTDLSAPRMYRLRLASRGLAPWRFLTGRLQVLWTSGEELAAQFPLAQPRVLGPIPSAVDLAGLRGTSDGVARIAFHATAAHSREHKFAAQLCAQLQRERDDFIFDVIAGKETADIWRGLRAEIRAPIPWPHYRDPSSHPGIDILVAPLAPVAVNAMRSPTKAIDAVRFGAAAILAESPAYEALRGAATLAPFRIDDWHAAITSMLDDRALIQADAMRLRDCVASWQTQNAPLFPPPLHVTDIAS